MGGQLNAAGLLKQQNRAPGSRFASVTRCPMAHDLADQGTVTVNMLVLLVVPAVASTVNSTVSPPEHFSRIAS